MYCTVLYCVYFHLSASSQANKWAAVILRSQDALRYVRVFLVSAPRREVLQAGTTVSSHDLYLIFFPALPRVADTALSELETLSVWLIDWIGLVGWLVHSFFLSNTRIACRSVGRSMEGGRNSFDSRKAARSCRGAIFSPHFRRPSKCFPPTAS